MTSISFSTVHTSDTYDFAVERVFTYSTMPKMLGDVFIIVIQGKDLQLTFEVVFIDIIAHKFQLRCKITTFHGIQ